MIAVNQIKKGDKVYYTTPYDKKTNGIVKRIEDDRVWVVYHCAGEWDNYENYTGALTHLDHISIGWVDKDGNLLEEYCDHYFIPSANKWEPIHKMTCQFCGKTIND